MSKSRLASGNEAIAHQTDRAQFLMLAALFNQIKSNELSIDAFEPAFKDIIRSMQISLEVKIFPQVTAPAAMIESPDISGSHSLIHDGRKMMSSRGRNDVSEGLWKGLNEQLAYINRDTPSLGGFFSKIPFKLYLAGGVFTQLTGEEAAAVVLHELGHAWSYCELLTYNLFTNHALETARNVYRGQNREEKIKLARYSSITSSNLERIDDLSEESYLKLISQASSRRLAKLLKDTDRSWYDRSSFEYLADQFATRMGSGRALVTGLDKMTETGAFQGFYKSRILSFIASTVKITGYILVSVTTGGVGFILIPLVTMLQSGDPRGDNGYGEYDNSVDRYKRIRHQVIDNLKDRQLPREIQKRALEDLAVIDKIVASMHESFKLGRSIWWLMSPSYRRALAEKEEQQLLETLANNDLHARAVELSHI